MQKWEKLPGDLQACVILAVATLFFTLLPYLSDLPVRIPLGLLMVLFVPGYNLIAALFPRRDDLDGVERVALSFGLSVAVVPLMGLSLNYTPWGIRLTPVVVSISLFTIVMAAAAYFRRMSLPEDERFSVDFRPFLNSARAELLADEKSRLDKALTILLILSIILSVSALAYVVVTPKQGEKFTEFYILGPKGKAFDYPTNVTAGNKSTLIVGVVNHEYSTVNYTMRLSFDDFDVLGQKQKIRLDHNQTWEYPVSYILSHPGNEQKLEFLLYKEDNFTAPYRDLHLWVNASSGGTEFYILCPAGKVYDYSTSVVKGDRNTLVVGVANHEYSKVNYTMYLRFDNLTFAQKEIGLGYNQTWEDPVSYALSRIGDKQKLQLLLYKENNFTAPYRDLHLWVNVSGSVGLRPTISVAPKAHISPVSPSLSDGSGGDGGEAVYISRSAKQIQPVKGGKQNVTNVSAIPAALGREQNVSKPSANITKGNISTVINKSTEFNRSKAAGNGSYNLTDGSVASASVHEIRPGEGTLMKHTNMSTPEVQAGQRNRVPVQLSSNVPRKTIVLGSRNSTKMASLG